MCQLIHIMVDYDEDKDTHQAYKLFLKKDKFIND